MKIIHVISSLGSGGAENLVCNLSVELARQGHSIVIAYITSAESAGVSKDYEDLVKRRLNDGGVAVFELGHSCRRNPILGGWRLRKLLTDFDADVIHVHLFYGLIFKALSGCKTPCVYTHHSIHIGKAAMLFPFFDFIVDEYVGICLTVKNALSRLTKRRVTLIYNAVQLDADTRKGAVPRDVVRGISVGRLDENKNYLLLVEAVDLLFKKRPELAGKFLTRVAGEGDQRAAISSRIEEKHLSDTIQLLGVRSDVPELLSDSDVFIMSSIHEGLPIALLEAIAAGLPVVVTDAGGCREVVEMLDAGLVVTANAQALAEALEIMIDDADLRAHYSNVPFSKFSDFSLSSAVGSHLSVYARLVSPIH